MNPLALTTDQQLSIPQHNGHRNETQAVACCSKRFAAFQSQKQSDSIRKFSVKFSANNFVTQSHDSFSKHYDMVELLGEGGYGEVYMCRYRETGAQRAVKILKVKTEEEQDTVLSEFNILRGIDHPNLL
jgi:serine/threonine protein kinase